jgi:hypothetical protein
MKKRSVLFLSLIFTFSLSFAQIKTPEKRPFNIGIFSGVGGINFTPIPGIDLTYKGTNLRLAPGYRVYSLGVTQQIMPLSEVFYNWYWIGSLYGAIGKEDDLFATGPGLKVSTSDFTNGILLTGVKVFFSLRWYSQLQAGAIYTKYETPGYPSDESVAPYFEFNIGFNLFRSYISEEGF